MNHNPVEVIKRLTEHYLFKIERPFYIFLSGVDQGINYCIGVTPRYSHDFHISVGPEDEEKTTDQIFTDIVEFITNNNLILGEAHENQTTI